MKELNYEKVFNTLVEETANYVTSNGLKAMVLGISGGIDSLLLLLSAMRLVRRPIFLL
jgi:NH3-dependent NAD+ synthetase